MKLSLAAKALKVRLAYEMNETGYPMTAEQVRLRPVLTKDARRVRLTGSYRPVAASVAEAA